MLRHTHALPPEVSPLLVPRMAAGNCHDTLTGMEGAPGKCWSWGFHQPCFSLSSAPGSSSSLPMQYCTAPNEDAWMGSTFPPGLWRQKEEFLPLHPGRKLGAMTQQRSRSSRFDFFPFVVVGSQYTRNLMKADLYWIKSNQLWKQREPRSNLIAAKASRSIEEALCRDGEAISNVPLKNKLLSVRGLYASLKAPEHPPAPKASYQGLSFLPPLQMPSPKEGRLLAPSSFKGRAHKVDTAAPGEVEPSGGARSTWVFSRAFFVVLWCP